MKILLSGCSGYFSKEFIKYVSKNPKIKLFCISRRKKKIRQIKLWKLDLSKKNIKIIPRNFLFDLVIHSSFVKINKNQNNGILEKNINITNNFIKILKENNFKKLLNLSTASLYSNTDGKFSENKKINFFHNTDSIYGLSKYLAEKAFNLHINNKKIIHLRLGNIIGNDSDNSIISKMKKTLIKKNFIEIYGNGNRIINLIHVQSLIKYILLISKKNLNGIFNLCDYSIDIRQIAKLIKLKYGKKNSKIKFLKKQNRNFKFYIVTNKFFNSLNIKKPDQEEIYNEI